jgi:hypothetical protein
MNPGTAFLLGFGACFLLWLATEVSWPRRDELNATLEEEFGLDSEKTPWRFWLFKIARFFFPNALAFWIDMRRTRRKKEPNDKEPPKTI